ncbi:MAG: hypothetical protein CFE23_11785 [Flavobacterium sp. BFFFF1]|uniref:hypothetical protein n=1 Tax=Flavobacterium sp. BFFFF1 TaxID=2015557 RepID=UPI000BDD1EFD|nr:hypothetical protein [Flavobacterium sp. BFFFF1]OYU79929.1 MAG: hypothetical protein CFE23_11785 [Flavobacterium sp. BFFFF1]
MEDNTNSGDNMGRYTERYEKGITELLEEKELKTKWHKEILENESIQEYFKDYNPHSIDTFILFYLTEKYLAYKYADSYERRVEEKRTRWIDAAYDHLKMIQHKKLFDLQCLWRAEQVQVEELEICHDFLLWKDNILDCPFLEPVTKDDIAMYQEYLLTADIDYRYITDFYDVQRYEEFRENYNGDEDDGMQLPDWYDFHNMRTGNGSLMILPDIRGEKEEFYKKLSRQEKVKNLPPSKPYVPERRPYLNPDSIEKVTFFVNTFEDEETRRKYANYLEINKNGFKDDEFDLDVLLMQMQEEDEYIPVEAHYDFREALFRGYNAFQLKNTAEHLPMAHQQYLFNRKMGLTTEEDREDVYKSIRERSLEMILDGRELNGEPRNLEF